MAFGENRPNNAGTGNKETSSENGNQGGNFSIVDFQTYEDYLDSQITPLDMFYLEDKELARQLVELGYRGNGEPLKREEFETRKKLIKGNTVSDQTSAQNVDQNTLISVTTEHIWKDDSFLRALAEREEPNRSGKMMSIIFIRTLNGSGQEVSGYIDYSYRLKTESFEHIFEMTKKLIPKSSDLSFYNWITHKCSSNHSPNFTVLTESEEGVMFKSKKDRKIINVDPNVSNAGDNTTRLQIKSPDYEQIVIYDHMTRRKA